MAKKKQEVATQEEIPSWMKEYEGQGQADIQQHEMEMPRLILMQAMSPMVKDKKAQEGDLIHSITNQILCPAGEKLRFSVVFQGSEYILWRDREAGGGIMARAARVVHNGRVRYKWNRPNTVFEDKIGGMVGVHWRTKTFIDEDGLDQWGTQIPSDPESKPAATLHLNYIICLRDHEDNLVALSMAKAAAKPGQKLGTMLKMGVAAIFLRNFILETFIDQAGENRFANYHFEPDGLILDEIAGHKMFKHFDSFRDKGVSVDFSDVQDGQKAIEEDKIPF